VDDGAISLEQLRAWLKVQAAQTKQPSLLVRASANKVPITDLTDITSAATEAGFVRVVVGALEPSVPARVTQP
jgi:biopolymer transport protein ExbD